MPVSWPDGLPYAVAQQVYGVQALDVAPMLSPMQSGVTRMRRQYTLRVAQLTYGWEFTAAQLGIFRSFVRDSLGAGTAELTLPVWSEPDQDYLSRTARIRNGSSGISEKKLGYDRTLVSLTLDVENL